MKRRIEGEYCHKCGGNFFANDLFRIDLPIKEHKFHFLLCGGCLLHMAIKYTKAHRKINKIKSKLKFGNAWEIIKQCAKQQWKYYEATH